MERAVRISTPIRPPERPDAILACRSCGWRGHGCDVVYRADDEREPWRCPVCSEPIVRIPEEAVLRGNL